MIMFFIYVAHSFNHLFDRYAIFFKGGTANAPKVAVTNYLDSIHKISSFQTVYFMSACQHVLFKDCISFYLLKLQVERFWQIYDHLKRPNDIKYSTEYHIFKEGISPTWEDPNNGLYDISL